MRCYAGGEIVTMRCPQCRHENREGARFCGGCGVVLGDVHTCPRCATPNPVGQKFCDARGAALTERAGAPARAVRAYTPRYLAEKILTTRSALEGFALLAAVALGVPGVGQAQQTTSLPRIGFLAPSSPTDPRVLRYLQAFRQGLRELGYVEGQNLAIEFRWAGDTYDRLPGLAAELVGLKVNVIVAGGSAAVQATKHATQTIPIVMVAVADPVAAGFVASFARPGGNITGVSHMLPELIGKQLELLKEVLPKVSRVALLGNPANPNHSTLVQQAQDAARAAGVRLQPLEARDPGDIDRAFAAIAAEQAGAVIVFTDAVLLDHRTRIADHAARRRLPTVFGVSQFAEAGGLLAYGPSLAAGLRRAPTYVDKILKGAKPADLPIEQPATFELVINLKTAKALGLTIPKSLVHRADQVIQ